MRIPSLTLLILLASVGAVRAEDLRGCDAAQGEVVRAAYDEAEVRTRAALEVLAREPDGDLARRWFGAAPRERVRESLKRVLGGLRPGRRPPTDCAGPAECRSGGTFAFARLDTRRIGVCARFFAAEAAMGRDSRFGVLVHEVSHLLARTVDAAYGPRAALELALSRPLVAAKNADNVEYFVEGAPAPPVRKGLVRAKVPVGSG